MDEDDPNYEPTPTSIPGLDRQQRAQTPAGTHMPEHDRPDYSVPEELERLILVSRQTKRLAGNNWRHELQPFRAQLHDALVELRSNFPHSPAEAKALWDLEDILEIQHEQGPTDTERLDFLIRWLGRHRRIAMNRAQIDEAILKAKARP